MDSDLRQSADSCNRRSRVCGGALEIGAGAFAEDQQASVNSLVDSAEKDSLVLTTGIDIQRHLPSMIDQQLKNLRVFEDIHMADELELSDFAKRICKPSSGGSIHSIAIA